MRFAILGLVIVSCFGCGDNATDRSDRSANTTMKPFQLPRGIEIADLSGIREAYSISKTEDGYYALTINVSAERIEPVFARLASEVKPPAFLLLETGTHRDVEKELRKNDTDPLHKDVYYLDGQTWADAKAKLAAYTHLLTHDGGINFGFGSHEGHDEIFVGPYKIFLSTPTSLASTRRPCMNLAL